jgi:predicted lipoprotein with Yx(FWY)xxD motif
MTKKVQGYGTVLATSSGQPVYVLSADPPGASKCTGRCAAEWPPLTKRGSLTAGSGGKGSLLSTLKRPDGSEQVAYNKHALYTHPGTPVALSAGTAADGGIWYLVSPSGDVIKATNLGGY